MRGQWLGKYTGSNDGLIIVNIDELSSHYEGVAYLNETNNMLPSTVAWFRTENKDKIFKFRTMLILPIDPTTGVHAPWDKIKGLFPVSVVVPEYADVSGSWEDDYLHLSWTTNIGTKGTCTLPQSKADKPSDLVAQYKKWEAYKEYVASLEGKRYLFRGQTKPWRLRTSFHRASRADITRFIKEDIQMLHKHLSSRTKHVFNLEIPNENGAFFNLVQHHGYPTPLLDWTYSPYVAAFFAYRNISNKTADEADPAEKVRIHVFDQARWKADLNQLSVLVAAGPHLSIGEFLAIENERMIPQQAASTITNVDDIESYIKSKESEDKKYLWAIDLPVRARKQIMHELGYMGITAGSLFPGFDGACEELRERNFDI